MKTKKISFIDYSGLLVFVGCLTWTFHSQFASTHIYYSFIKKAQTAQCYIPKKSQVLTSAGLPVSSIHMLICPKNEEEIYKLSTDDTLEVVNISAVEQLMNEYSIAEIELAMSKIQTDSNTVLLHYQK